MEIAMYKKVIFVFIVLILISFFSIYHIKNEASAKQQEVWICNQDEKVTCYCRIGYPNALSCIKN